MLPIYDNIQYVYTYVYNCMYICVFHSIPLGRSNFISGLQIRPQNRSPCRFLSKDIKAGDKTSCNHYMYQYMGYIMTPKQNLHCGTLPPINDC